jgi:tol-pal system beta propeller repeat protein TolB
MSRMAFGLVLFLVFWHMALPESAAQTGLVPCLSSKECPGQLACHWGVCNPGLALGARKLFQWSVLDIPDLTTSPGTHWLRGRFANRLAELLASTSDFLAVRHGGHFPVDTETLLAALSSGSGYLFAAHLQQFDGQSGSVMAQVIEAETGAIVPELSGIMEFTVDGLDEVLERYVNRVVLYFSGRPGLLGVRIACVRKLAPGVKEIFMLSYGTGDIVQLTHDNSLALLPSWTHHGRIAYTSYREERPKIFIDGMKTPFTAFEGMNSGIEWSLDGSMAAVTLAMDGNSEIYLLEGTTGEVRARLTYDEGIDTSPTWSPDGNRLAFCTDRDGTPQIYTMNVDGSNKQRITWSGTYNTSPDWHPFGPHLAFAGRVGSEFQVFRLDLLDGAVHQLTYGPGDCEAPDWSPDGRMIACACGSRNAQNIYVMNPDGSGKRALTVDDGPYFAPVWEPLQRPE